MLAVIHRVESDGPAVLKRSHLIVLGVLGLVVVLAIGFGASQLVSQRDTISNLTRSVSSLKASVAKARTPQTISTAKLKTEIDAVLVATLGHNFGSPGGLTGFVGSTTIHGDMTQAIANLQSNVQTLLTGQGSTSTLSTLQADATSLQNQINTLNSRLGTAPASPDISTLLDQAVSYINCLRQNSGSAVDQGNC
jgi:hypothetical protein